MNRIRVLMISGNPPEVNCGVSHYTRNLLVELRSQRPQWKWLWLSRRSRWFHSPVATSRGTTIFKPHHAWDGVGKGLAGLMASVLQPDLIHIQDGIHSFHETDAAAHIASVAKCPVITTLHEFHNELPSVVNTIDLVERSTAIIANDRRTFDRCREHTGRTPDLLGWSAANITPSPEYDRDATPKFLTTFGCINELKLLDLAYDAISLINPEQRGLRWVIVGPFDPVANSYHRELQQRFSAPWVTFTGALNESEIENVFRKTAVMLLPFADGASVRRGTLQAAWAFGLPVVTTAPPASEPAIRDDGNCLIAETNSPRSWADATARVLDDQLLATRLSEEGRKSAQNFSWERLAQLHLNLYDRILNSKHTRRADPPARSAAF